MILLDINGASAIVRKQDILTSGMVGAKVVFCFDEDWESLAKTAVFRAGKVIKDAVVVDSVSEIPHEVLAAPGVPLEIGVYGTADDGAVVIPTVWAKTNIIKRGTDPSGDESLDPTLPIWAQMQEQIKEIHEVSEETKEITDNAVRYIGANMVIGKTEGESIYLDDAADQFLVGLRIFGKTTQDGTPTPDAPVDLVSASDINVTVAGKNLLECTAASTTNSGITFAVSPDGSIVANGTATANAYLLVGKVELDAGTYFLSGNSTGSSTTHRIFITNGVNEYNTYTADRVFTVTEPSTWSVSILVMSGKTVTNVKYYPMVRVAAITDSTFERYKTSMKMAVAVSNGLHGIPVASGGNYTDANGQQWICDEIDFAKGVYIQKIGVKTFDGSNDEYWYSENALANTSMFRIGILDSVNAANVVGKDFVCSHFTPMGIYAVDAEGAQHSGYQFYFRILNSTLSTANVAGFQAFLAASPVTLLYVLATPIETALSKGELAAYATLRTYRDNTTVSNDASAHMELEYVMDARKYIDSLVRTPDTRIVSVSLLASKWVGSGTLYSQVVTIAGITENSQVNLTPSVEQMSIFYDKDLTFVTENDGGVVTVYVIGQKPQNDYTIQADIVEVIA